MSGSSRGLDRKPKSALVGAAAMGLPVVTTAVGGIRHQFEDSVEALLVAANDDLAMAEAVSTLVHDGDLARSLVDCARRRVLALDWPVVGCEWRKLLSSLAVDCSG